MTNTDCIDRPTTANIVLSPAALLDHARDLAARNGRPTWCSHPVLEATIEAMREADRTDLVHYAGASHRDDVAWQVALAWLADPEAPESVLKGRALAIAWRAAVDAASEVLEDRLGRTMATLDRQKLAYAMDGVG